MKLALFAACAPGLEPLLAREIEALGLEFRIAPGGVETAGDRRVLARLLIELGLASHLLVRIASFHVRDLGHLEEHVARLPWSGWLRAGVPRRVRVTVARSRLHHTRAIEERILRGIARRLDHAPLDDAPLDDARVVPLLARLFEDRCTISLDASGESLHRRGYRLNPGRAPLREDIARALVVASGWDRQSLFIDPMCGSGTIAIEAALLAQDRAPGLNRAFAMEYTPLDDGIALHEARDAARKSIRPSTARILARDRDARAVEVARANAERAGVGGAIEFEVGPLSRTLDSLAHVEDRGETPCIVTNPPWGERIGARESLTPLYRGLGQLRHAARARLTLAAHDRRLAYATGVRVESAFMSDLGGLKIHAMTEKRPGPEALSENQHQSDQARASEREPQRRR